MMPDTQVRTKPKCLLLLEKLLLMNPTFFSFYYGNFDTECKQLDMMVQGRIDRTRTVSRSEAAKVGRPIRSTAARNLATSLPPAAAAAAEAPPCSGDCDNLTPTAERTRMERRDRRPTSSGAEAAAGPSSLRSAAARIAPSASAARRSSSDARGAGSGSPSPASSARSHATASDRRRRRSPLSPANQTENDKQ